MIRKIAGWLLTTSETELTVLGTLLISFGMNLLTSGNLWTSSSMDFYDVLKLSAAFPTIFIGVVLFRFIDDCRRWVIRKDAYLRGSDDITELPKEKDEFIGERLSTKYVKRSLLYMLLSLLLLAIPLLLISWKVKRDWNGKPKADMSPVSIGYQQTAISRHLFIAKEKGFFDQEGVTVDLTPFPSANTLMEGIVTNQLDGAALINLQVALTVQAKDSGVFKLINMQVWGRTTYPDYILVPSDSSVKTVKDLEGQVVGVHPGSATRAFARAVFDHFHADPTKVTFIELEPPLMQAAVSSKRVAAIYCMDPVATALIENGLGQTLVSNPMQFIFDAPVPIAGTVLSTKFLMQRPEDAKKVINAIDKAIRFTREPGNDEEIASFVAKYTPVSKPIALKMNPSEYWTLDEIDRERVQELSTRFYQLGIIPQPVDVAGILFDYPEINVIKKKNQ